MQTELGFTAKQRVHHHPNPPLQRNKIMSTTQLTPAQHTILAKAINTSSGRIEWFPDNIKGGARTKVLQGLLNRALITPDGEGWRVDAEGYAALGMKRPEPPQRVPNIDPELDLAVDAAQATWKQQPKPAKPSSRTRENSKQAEVIRMLQRPEGASVRQICEVTGWQAHTVRGTFAGAFKKKLGMTITSDKQQGGERIYRVA
jgi:hypothetical protein